MKGYGAGQIRGRRAALAITSLLTCLVPMLTNSDSSAAQLPDPEELYAPFIERENDEFETPQVIPKPENEDDTESRPLSFNYVGAEHIAPILKVSAAGSNEPFVVEVRDGKTGDVLNTIDGDDIDITSKTFEFQKTSFFSLVVIAEDFNRIPNVLVAGMDVSYVPISLLATEKEKESRGLIPNYRSVSDAPVDLTIVHEVSESVAKILVNGGACTGFLHRERYLITNYHCVRRSKDFAETRNGTSAEACADISYGFDYTVGNNAYAPMTVTGQCRRVVYFSFEYDLAVMEIDAPPPTESGPRKSLEFTSEPLSGQQKAVLVHHPLGLPQQYQSEECTVVADIDPNQWKFVEDINIPAQYDRAAMAFHQCDTDTGSSGSALVSPDDGKVVALHAWSSFPTPADACSRWHNPHAQRKYRLLGYKPVNRGIQGHLIEARLTEVLN